MNVTLTAKEGNSVAMRVGRNAEVVAAAIEVRPVNKDAYEQAEAQMPSIIK
jgi:hypothetical protein